MQKNIFKEASSFLLTHTLLALILFSLIGCEDKKPETAVIPIENTTEVFTTKEKNVSKKTMPEKAMPEKKISIPKTLAKPESLSDTFTFINTQETTHKLTFSKQKLSFHDVNKPVVIINLFTTTCSDCRSEISSLSKLQKKYQKQIFVAGVLVHDTQDNPSLDRFLQKYKINYYVSNSTHNDTFAVKLLQSLHIRSSSPFPLTVIYKEGNYYSHFEGSVPMEMLNHDIQEAIKK